MKGWLFYIHFCLTTLGGFGAFAQQNPPTYDELAPRPFSTPGYLENESGPMAVPQYLDGVVWPNGELFRYYSGLDLAPLRFTNRAQCAVDSNKPTSSFFMVVDSYNAGKVAHSWATSQGLDRDLVVEGSLQAFRISTTLLATQVLEKLLKGDLPILPYDYVTGKPHLKNWSQAAAACEQKNDCFAKEKILKNLWSSSSGTPLKDWQKWDGFKSSDFFSQPSAPRLSCYYVKRFSALQGHLRSPFPTQEVLQSLGADALSNNNVLADCFSADKTLNSRHAVIQIDLSRIDQKLWDAIGFDVWNSFKIYFSWAWRNSSLLQETAPDFASIFRTLAIEESLLFVPNGCKGMEKPQCDQKSLALNSIRKLATLEPTDHSREVPDGPEKDLIKNPIVSVNRDELSLMKESSSADWVKRFRQNLTQHRGLFKTRFYSAIQNLEMISTMISAPELARFVEDIGVKTLSDRNQTAANLLYFLCSETDMASNEKFSLLKADIDRLISGGLLDPYNQLSDQKVSSLILFYQDLASHLNPICQTLQSRGLWNPPFQVESRGFRRWFKELTKLPDLDQEWTPPQSLTSAPLLTIGSPATSTQTTLCADAVECSRKIVNSVVDLHATALYADAFLSLSQEVQSPNLLNPYSERVACKVYDPWFKTRAAIKELAVDLTNTALFGWNSLPIFVSAQVKPGQVVSFNKLVQDGKVKFSPEIIPEKYLWTLMADLGPALNIPCTISIGQTPIAPLQYYAVTGLLFSGCTRGTDNVLNVTGPNDLKRTEPKTRSACGSCYLSLDSVTAVPSVSGFNPGKFGAYLFRSVLRFAQSLSHPDDIPRTSTIDVNEAAEIYRKYGTIPKKCVSTLARGLSCYENQCDSQIAKTIELKYGAPVTHVYSQNLTRFQSRVETLGCSGHFLVDAMKIGNRSCDTKNAMRVLNIRAVGDCANLRPQDGAP